MVHPAEAIEKRHWVGSQERMKRYGGTTIDSKPPVSTSAYSSRKPYGRMRLNDTASEYGSSPAKTFPPSSGGIGIMLKTAKSTLSRIAWFRITASGADTF